MCQILHLTPHPQNELIILLPNTACIRHLMDRNCSGERIPEMSEVQGLGRLFGSF